MWFKLSAEAEGAGGAWGAAEKACADLEGLLRALALEACHPRIRKHEHWGKPFPSHVLPGSLKSTLEKSVSSTSPVPCQQFLSFCPQGDSAG